MFLFTDFLLPLKKDFWCCLISTLFIIATPKKRSSGIILPFSLFIITECLHDGSLPAFSFGSTVLLELSTKLKTVSGTNLLKIHSMCPLW
jgi:hypothetical protein